MLQDAVCQNRWAAIFGMHDDFERSLAVPERLPHLLLVGALGIEREIASFESDGVDLFEKR